MAFNELVSLPVKVRAGTGVDDRHDTDIVVVGDLAKEKRNKNTVNFRKRFTLITPVIGKAEFQELRNFYNVVGAGRFGGFRYHDRDDYQALDLVNPLKPQPGVVSAAAGTYQLQREITIGGVYLYKDITKPVPGTVKVYVSGARKLESDGTYGWSLDTTTGIITFDTPGNVTVDALTVNYQFDTPVRFDDDGFKKTNVDHLNYSVRMSLIELIL